MTEYLTRAVELEKHAALCAAKGETACANGWLDQVHWLAGDDEDLFAVMWSFANFSHAFDDLLDGSGWSADMIEAGMASLHDAVVAHLRNEPTHDALRNFLTTWRVLLQRVDLDLESARLANKAMSDFFLDLQRNPFARRYNRELETVFVQCMCRCLDGDAMAQSADPAKRALAPAVRCGDVDVLMHMVYLRRGWAALRAVSGFREYDQEDKAESGKQKAEMGNGGQYAQAQRDGAIRTGVPDQWEKTTEPPKGGTPSEEAK